MLPADADAYVARMEAALRLSGDRQTAVRQEIRDHLTDSAAEFRRLGRSDADAMATAIAGLGSPEILGERISHEERTRRRFFAGILGAAVSALYGAAIGLGFSGVVIVGAPVVATFLVAWVAGVGIHLYMPASPEWQSEQIALALDAAAFFAARRATPVVAENTRRALRTIKPVWGFGGAAVLTLAALLAPAALDPLVAASLLVLPFAWLFGAWRCQGPGDDLASRRGVAQALVLMVVVLFLPGVRIWAFDPTTPVSAAAPWSQTSTRISVDTTTGEMSVEGEEHGWSAFEIQALPVTRQGLQVVPDRSAPGATFDIAEGGALATATLPDAPHDWWLVLTARSTDGSRHTLDVLVTPGTGRYQPTNILSWLLGGR